MKGVRVKKESGMEVSYDNAVACRAIQVVYLNARHEIIFFCKQFFNVKL